MKVLERLQVGGNTSTLARDECGTREAVRSLQEQLVKERAKNHRTVNKRCQEQRLLMEQVHLPQLLLHSLSNLVKPRLMLIRWFCSTPSPHNPSLCLVLAAGGVESIRKCSPLPSEELDWRAGAATERVRQSQRVLHLPYFLFSFHPLTRF